MSIDLTNMKIERVVIHTVPKRTVDRAPGTPTYATGIITLPPASSATFQARVVEALGGSSHGIAVAIVEETPGSFFQIAASLMYADDKTFLQQSRLLPDRLAVAQANRDLAASKLLVASGKAGKGRKRFLVVIKAELQDGFSEQNNSIAHLTELFLTPSQKLFKIGFISEEVAAAPMGGMFDSANFKAHLFDHLMNASETRDAAHYFYSQFLGAGIIASDKRLTKSFYELTKEFINSAPVEQEKKVEMLEALRVDLRSKSAVVHVTTFAKQHLDSTVAAEYIKFMEGNSFPKTAVDKNLDFIGAQLRKKRKIRFEHGVEITAPGDTLHTLVKIDKAEAGKTVITINGSIEYQE